MSVQHVATSTCYKTVILSALSLTYFLLFGTDSLNFVYFEFVLQLTTPLLFLNNTLELPYFVLYLKFVKVMKVVFVDNR